jgi:hypothetical protein
MNGMGMKETQLLLLIFVQCYGPKREMIKAFHHAVVRDILLGDIGFSWDTSSTQFVPFRYQDI